MLKEEEDACFFNMPEAGSPSSPTSSATAPAAAASAAAAAVAAAAAAVEAAVAAAQSDRERSELCSGEEGGSSHGALAMSALSRRVGVVVKIRVYLLLVQERPRDIDLCGTT